MQDHLEKELHREHAAGHVFEAGADEHERAEGWRIQRRLQQPLPVELQADHGLL